MASLALGAVGAVVGSAIGGPGGAAWGWNIGVTLGGVLFPPKLGEQNLGKLDDLRLSGSGYGAMIPQVWGRVRIGGNVIWTTDLKENIQKTKQKSKGGGGQTVNNYTYSASLAIAVCKGPATVKRIWAEDLLLYDDDVIPSTKYDITLYSGNESQNPDPLMESIIGSGWVPAYRGLCYVVFEDLLLTDWGNRIPNFTFEISTGTQTVHSVLDDLCEQVGIDESDTEFTDTDTTVQGFVLAQRAAVRDIIDPLLRVYAIDLTEFGGKINAIRRGGASVATIPESDLGAVAGNTNSQDFMSTRVLMDTDLPYRLDLTYFSFDRLYQQMTQSAVRQTKGLISEATTINSLLVLSDDLARQTAERLIYSSWLERYTFQFSLPAKYYRLGPGDVILMPVNGVLTRTRIISRDAGLFGELRFNATLDESDVLTQYASGESSSVIIPPLQAVVDTHFKVWSCPILREEDRTYPGFYVAATGPNQWKGCIVYYSTDNGATWIEGGTITDRSVIGETTNALADGTDPLEVDTVNTLSVALTDTGTLESTAQTNVDAGQNASLVGNEVLGFRTATLTGSLEYDLTNLTRGFKDTDMTGHANGEMFVLLEETVIRVEVGWSLVGQTLRVKCVSDGQTLGAVTDYQEVTICNPSLVQSGGRSETWIVQSADDHLSNSDKTYTRDLQYEAKEGTIWLSIRRLMKTFSSVGTLTVDDTGKQKRVIITVDDALEEGDEIGLWYVQKDSSVLAMKKDSFTVSVAGDQSITIPETPLQGSVRVWLREYRLRNQSFTVDNDTISIINGDLDIQPGDLIHYVYIPSSAPVASYNEDALAGVNGQSVYNAGAAAIQVGGEYSFIADVGGRIDPNATMDASGAVTLTVDMTDSDGIPVTIRRYT